MKMQDEPKWSRAPEGALRELPRREGEGADTSPAAANAPHFLPLAQQEAAQAKALRRQKLLVGACLLIALAASILALIA
ncbi:hypothetical protein QTH97_30630 [Variovorax sp. J22R24]|uniref:hypothetical protein n=1 Tax=Variovorax gracilis TaxID=3053502 RepID=UPI0025753B4E|nr:hypothetical protein [Variovorax sp. J22R24]MDM0109322.1 hypothetical protein [Variovorax sp. J22R24]